MRKIDSIMILAVMILAACQPKTQPVDTVAAKVEVNDFMDTYLKLWNAKDVKALTALLAEDGIFCGTDPSELMNKKTISDAWVQAFADTTLTFTFAVDKREIRVESDGNSAIVMEQFIVNPYTPKIPWRLVSHVFKTDDSWKFDFISWNLIPKNEDIPRLNKALE